VHARFPHAEPRHSSINQTVTPDPEPTILLGKVIPDFANFIRKELSLVMPRAPRAFGLPEVKHFIHPRMTTTRFENITDFVDQFEHNSMHVGVQWTVALAIKSVFIGPLILFRHFDPRRFIELRIRPQ